MRVLVAGGLGFIGRAVVARVRARGWEAAIADQGDFPAALTTPADALVWAAGCRGPSLASMLADHAEAPAAAVAALPGLRRVVFLSSGECYGAQAVPFGEDAPLLGASAYARAKIAGERAVTEVAAARGASVVILRVAVAYGPGQSGPMFVPALAAALARRERFAMTAGAQTRDLVHVADVAAAVCAGLGPSAPPGVYNVGTGREVALLDVARRLARLLAGEELLEVGAVPYREGEQMRYALDPARARARLGWAPAIGLDEGLAEVAAGVRAGDDQS